MQMYLYISNNKTYIHKTRHIYVKLKLMKGINNHINQKPPNIVSKETISK